MAEHTTRLAPSPTGALHLGNARTFLINWALAQQRGWHTVLRIEDLDTPRIKPGAQQQAIDDLRWLGMSWDGEPLIQTRDLSPYRAALDQLNAKGLLYSCTCTRSDIVAAQSAPNLGDHELRYPGTCRPPVGPAVPADGRGGRLMVRVPATSAAHGADRRPAQPALPASALRIIIPGDLVTFLDEFAGPQSINVQQQVGDFVVASKAGLPAYQLAVVIDDARQGVTDIVRGDDLIGSAARQLWLYRFLDLTPLPRYWHLPLVVGEDGRRLAKRHGDTRLAWYRDQGVPAERIIGLLAKWSGIAADRRPMTTADFVQRFDLASLPRECAVFTMQDHAWLLEGTSR